MQQNSYNNTDMEALDQQIQLKAEGLYKRLHSKSSFFTGHASYSNLSVKNARSEKLFFSYERKFVGQSQVEIGYLRPSQESWSNSRAVVLSSTQDCDAYVKAAFEKSSDMQRKAIRHFWGIEKGKPISGLPHSNHRAILKESVCSAEIPCSECEENGKLECYTCSGSGQKACPWCLGNGITGCDTCKSSGATHCFSCNGSGSVSRSQWGNETCGKCQGRRTQLCSSCYGAHSRTTRERDFQGNYHTVVTTCTACSFGSQTCFQCYGTGSISKMVTVSERCTHCHGGGSQQCSSCKGTGDVRCGRCRGHGEVHCSDCEATGIISCSTCYGQGTRFYEGGVVCTLTNTLGAISFDEKAEIIDRGLCNILSISVKNKDLPFGCSSILVEQIDVDESEFNLNFAIKTIASVPLFRADVEFFGETFPHSALINDMNHFEGEQGWHDRMLDLVIHRLRATDVNLHLTTLGIAHGIRSISEKNPFLESLFDKPEFFDPGVTNLEFMRLSPEPMQKNDELVQLSSKLRSDVIAIIVDACQSGKILYRFFPSLLGLIALLSLLIVNSKDLVFIREDVTSTLPTFDLALSIYGYQHWFDSTVFEITGPWSFAISEIKLWHILLPSIMIGITSLTFLLRPYHRWRLKDIYRFERIKHFVHQGLPRHSAKDLVFPLCLVITPIMFTVLF